MNQKATIQKLEEMRFSGFVRAYREMTETGVGREFTTDEVIAHLVQAEWDDRFNRRLQSLLARARFRYRASLEEIDFSAKRNLDLPPVIGLSKAKTLLSQAPLVWVKVLLLRHLDIRDASMDIKSYTATVPNYLMN